MGAFVQLVVTRGEGCYLVQHIPRFQPYQYYDKVDGYSGVIWLGVFLEDFGFVLKRICIFFNETNNGNVYFCHTIETIDSLHSGFEISDIGLKCTMV